MADDLTAIKQRIDKAHTEICEIAEQGVSRRWRMHIPAQPDRDSDLVISRALKDAEGLADEVEQWRASYGETALHGARDILTRLKTAEADAERVRAVAVEILGHFHQAGHPGGPCRRTGWIPEQQIEAWRAALDHPTDTTEEPDHV